METVSELAEFNRHQGPVYSLCRGQGEGNVFSGGADGTVAEWDLEKLEAAPFRVDVGHAIFSLRYIPGKELLLIGRASGALHVIDLAAREEVRHLELHKRGIFDICYDERQERILTAGGDGTLSVLDARNFELIRSIPLAEKKLRKMDIDPGSGDIAVASGAARIHVLDPEMYNEKLTLSCHHPGVNAVKFLSGDSRLLSAGRDGHLDIWDPERPEAPLFHIPAHYYPIYSIVASPQNDRVATCSRDRSIKFWDPGTGDFLSRIDRKREGEGHRRSVNALHWSEGNGLLVSGGDDGRLMVWEVAPYSASSSE